MNRKTLLLLGLAAVAAYYFFGKKTMSEAQAKLTWTPPRRGGPSPVPGVAAGTIAPVQMSDGSVLDPQGIPIGAKLADGSTWAGVTVQDTSRYVDDGRF